MQPVLNSMEADFLEMLGYNSSNATLGAVRVEVYNHFLNIALLDVAR